MSERDHIPDPELLLRHGASVRALAGAILGDPHAADDVAQETFLAALRGGAVPVRDTGAWLRGVTRNLARRWIRTESRRRNREEVQAQPVAPASPEETAARLETETSLTDAVRALSEPYRTVVVLRYFDGLSTAETAARTDVPEATVKTRLRRGLAMLRDTLDSRYGRRSAWIPLLIRVARPNDPAAVATAAGTATLVAGGTLMAKKILIVTVFAAVLAAVIATPLLTDLTGPGPRPEDVPEDPALVADGAVRPEVSNPASEADADAASPKIPAEEAFRVRVRYPDGRPAGAATVELADLEEKKLGSARTDDEGLAVLRATGAAGVVHVRAAGAVPESREVEAFPDTEVVVDLAEGSVISGTLFFGRSPAAGREVRLQAMGGSIPQLAVVTDARGGFRFTGLTAGTHYSFFAGWDVWYIEPKGEQNVRIAAPAKDLAIRAGLHPSIRGRVVDSEGSPVKGARVDCSYRAGKEIGGSSQTKSGADGSFAARATVGETRIDFVEIKVTAPDGVGREIIRLPASRLRAGDIDAGSLVIRATRTYRFEVTGPDGKPASGALVLPSDDLSRASAPTDGSGRTELAVAAGTTSVQVGSRGTGTTEVRLPGEPDGVVPVRLPGGTLLTLRMRRQDGTVPPYLALEVRADTRLMEGPEDLVWELHPRIGSAKPTETHVTDEVTELRFQVPGDGVVRLGGIRPGVAFRILIRDRVSGGELETRELKLDPGEHRDVDVTVTVIERDLVISARDPEGRPVAGARVVARTGRGGVSTKTTALGIARIPGLRGEEIHVEVRKHGFAPFVEAFPLASLPEKVTAVLRPGRTVRLTVVDPAGKPVACPETEARVADLDYEFQGYEVAEGIYEFRDLPATAVRLLVTYAGKVHEVVAAAADSSATISMPATATVVVRFAGTLDEPVTHQVRLIPTAGGTEVIHDIGYQPIRDEWEVRIPAVMPGTYRVVLEHWVDQGEDGKDIYEVCRKGGTVRATAGNAAETSLPR